MSFPVGVQTVTVTAGPVLNVAGSPQQGALVALSMTVPVRIVDSGIILPSRATAYTDAAGMASLTVVACDSTGIDRTDWTYRVTAPGMVPESAVFLPAGVPTVRVEDLAPVDASDGSVVWIPDYAAAVIARNEAVAARDVALGARDGADSAAGVAVAARDVALGAETGAETAQGLAVTAKNEAVAARTGAETARTGAETAQTGAGTARDAAVIAKDGAVDAEAGAVAAKEAAEAAAPDTGVRNVSALYTDPDGAALILIQRVGVLVHCWFNIYHANANPIDNAIELPPGFRGQSMPGGILIKFPSFSDTTPVQQYEGRVNEELLEFWKTSTPPASGVSIWGYFAWRTKDPWPATLPGVPE